MTALFACAAFAGETCTAAGERQHAALAKVIDGDTLALDDGRHVRLIGINAPENARGQRAAEPGAALATSFARQFLGTRALALREGEDSRDRYERTLANVWDADGRSLEEALLRAGLARAIVMPPNIALARCLFAAEHAARAAPRGLWASGEFVPRHVATLIEGEGGFRLLRGRAGALERSRSSWWIELDGRVALQITRADWRYFDTRVLEALRGNEIEVRGWLIWRDSPANRARGRASWLLRVGHPLLIEAR